MCFDYEMLKLKTITKLLFMLEQTSSKLLKTFYLIFQVKLSYFVAIYQAFFRSYIMYGFYSFLPAIYKHFVVFNQCLNTHPLKKIYFFLKGT